MLGARNNDILSQFADDTANETCCFNAGLAIGKLQQIADKE